MNASAAPRRETAGAPPWVWFWVALFTFYTPERLLALGESLAQMQAQAEGLKRLQSISPQTLRFAYLGYPGYITEHIPALALTLGVLTVLFPTLRARYLEWRWQLRGDSPSVAAVAEIKEFLRTHAPALEVKINLLRPQAMLFVYPSGYRRTTVALFGGFLRLWKSDREAAEALLLHEIGHARRGDALIVGPGSFMENALKLTLLYYAFFVALPYIITAVDQTMQMIRSHREMTELTRSISEMGERYGVEAPEQPSLLPILLNSVLISVVGLLSTTAAFLTRTVAVFVLPLACIWTAELNADRFVAGLTQYEAALRRAIGQHAARGSIWKRLMFRFSHPPDSLRRWFLGGGGSSRLVWLLLLFPLAFFVRLAALHLWTFLVYQGIGTASALGQQPTEFTMGKFLLEVVTNTRLALASQPGQWLMMTCVLLVWPLAFRVWDAFFSRTRATTGQSVVRRNYSAYVLGALFTATVYLLAYALAA